MFYEMTIAGCKRQLPLCRLNDELMIGAFVILGDQELTVACAKALLEISPDYDYLISAEAKGIPLAHEMARQHGDKKYMVARKGVKLYMRDIFEAKVRSITTDHEQTLYLDKADADLMKGKRILVVDDVVSTGESLYAIQELVKQAGGDIVANVTILAEGEAADRTDIKYLEKLPLFNAKGEPIC
ncbi:MAG: adenine phosphoribosyltransferase [Clostridia bacterium]|nr:adenine phosphoribosyltransferase [Clostridia bacterium]